MKGRVAVTGSVAYDTIMVFPGRFGDHILAEKTHLINVSFLVERLQRRRGGTAANIAYTMALLGERPLLCAAAGSDFGDAAVLEAAGVDIGGLVTCDEPTAAAYITTDLDDNQITAFHPGAMARGAEVDLSGHSGLDCVVVGPDSPEGMARHVEQAASLGARLVYAPAQQIPSLPDGVLRSGLLSAWLVVGNDYELEMVRSRTGLAVSDLTAAGATVAVTRGGEGSEVTSPEGTVRIPVAPVDSLVDPTGAGDAYLAGLVTGLRRGLPAALAGRIGALAAAYVVERPGTQEHTFGREEFARRYRAAFGDDLPAL